jgi:dihydrofolate synthase / folylpolyglutamate synthase
MGRYQDALNFIFGYVNYEKQPRYTSSAASFDLGRMHQLLDRLGRPQDSFQSVHIAGTKGKGSTAAMVEASLRQAGHKTGLFTSPHLHSFRERIRVDGGLVSKRDLVAVLDEARPAITEATGITAFEITTALAFLYFARSGVEWAVLEVGLGGRLDATNVVHPAVCGITSLSYDHVELLGHTLSLIAWEKAGIIKAGVPVVSAPQAVEAAGVIRRVCSDTGARLIQVGETWRWQPISRDLSGQKLTITGPQHKEFENLQIRLLGQHQQVNATTAVAMLSELQAKGVRLTDDDICSGVAAARWPGRFEVLNREPVLVVDSAHNSDSAGKLRSALRDLFPIPPFGRLALLFGASNDKDITGMLETFLTPSPESGFQPADKVIVTRSGHPRQTDPVALAEMVRRLSADVPTSVQDSLTDALAEAMAWARPGDVVCVTGSIFVVAQARLTWASQHPEAFPVDDWVFADEGIDQIVPDDPEEPGQQE